MYYFSINISKNILKKILSIKKVSINSVGVKNIYYPIIFDIGKGKLQKTLGLWNFNIFLIKFKRGVHMSRFFKIIENIFNKPLKIKSFYYLYKIILPNLQSNSLFYQVSFIYFLKKISPISYNKSLMNYKITLSIKKINIFINYLLKIVIPIISLCPCSKFISKFNAHNQRSYVSIFLKIKKNIDIINIIKLVENQSSSELWTLLKRNDEKFITEFLYKNPKFIEDLVRNISDKFNNLKYIYSYIIKIENLESIHNHNVYSLLKKNYN